MHSDHGSRSAPPDGSANHVILAGMNSADLSRIQRCETQLKDFLAELLNKVPLDTLSQVTVAGKWSAREHLAHLARYHEVFLERLERMLADSAPVFARYRAEDDPAWEAWRQLSSEQILSRLDTLRRKVVSRLQGLSEDDFQRTGIHPRLGKMKLSMWLEFFLVHEGHHLYAVLMQAAAPR